MNLLLALLCFGCSFVGGVSAATFVVMVIKPRVPVHVDILCRRHGCPQCGPLPVDVRCN